MNVPISPVTMVRQLIGISDDKKVEDLDENEAIDLFMGLDQAAKVADRQLKILTKAKAELEQLVVDQFAEHGQSKVSRNGLTLYIAREQWPLVLQDGLEGEDPSEAARQRLLEALAADPMTEHLVQPNYNHSKLRSFILHDCEEDEAGKKVMPEHLEGVLGVAEKFRAKVSASSGK